MIRKTAVVASVLAAVLAVGGSLSGCKVQVAAHTGDEPPAPKPAPPPPAPAPAPKAEEPKPAPPPAPAPAKPPETKPPEVKAAPSKIVQKGDSLQMPGNIVFDTDKATLKAGSGSEVVLEDLKQFLIENDKKISTIRIEGYTDNQGKPDHNLELSGQRALTIKKWLVDHGIDAKRVIAVGFGQDKPVAPNTTEEGKAQNRRTEFKIAQVFDKKGKVVKYLGGDPLGGGKEFK